MNPKQILTINLKTGETLYRETMADRSLSTRGLDGPVWSPDGKSLAFIVDGVLWTQPVDKTGKATGAARQITTEPTDAPTWSGDSKTLLYLVSGQLRAKGASEGVAPTRAHASLGPGRLGLPPDLGTRLTVRPERECALEQLVKSEIVEQHLAVGELDDLRLVDPALTPRTSSPSPAIESAPSARRGNSKDGRSITQCVVEIPRNN